MSSARGRPRPLARGPSVLRAGEGRLSLLSFHDADSDFASASASPFEGARQDSGPAMSPGTTSRPQVTPPGAGGRARRSHRSSA